MEAMEKLKQIIAQTENLVFFGGAGVSTESGIPDFRSVDGVPVPSAVGLSAGNDFKSHLFYAEDRRVLSFLQGEDVM